MSDILNIRVTERELDLIMDLLHEAGLRTDADGQPAIEICHDLMEQAGREVDEWESTDLDGRTFTVAEDHFIDLGMRAREMRKAEKMARGVSMAADRRAHRFGEFSVDDPNDRSDQQRVDVWERPNDPTKW
tara:strand:+ start:4597 stop:4989 length:393 start_codon:yes stop_codon:yes gene_type:complete